jgi:hypothetical protein
MPLPQQFGLNRLLLTFLFSLNDDAVQCAGEINAGLP